ncbi:hypothetical protein QN411_09310, partial [Pseudomonas sp. CCI1.1]|uniref:hypothetical protein n=1 Tax=Pseudomonas sp. CCI1.1 TaxID=3048613 RepID=UPI002B232D3D
LHRGSTVQFVGQPYLTRFGSLFQSFPRNTFNARSYSTILVCWTGTLAKRSVSLHGRSNRLKTDSLIIAGRLMTDKKETNS